MDEQVIQTLGEQLQQALGTLCATHEVALRAFSPIPVRLTDGGMSLFAVAVLDQERPVPVTAMRAIRRLIGISGQVNDSQNTTLRDCIVSISITDPAILSANIAAFEQQRAEQA